MKIHDKEIHVEGRLIRVGSLADERYEFFDDPEAALDALRAARGAERGAWAPASDEPGGVQGSPPIKRGAERGAWAPASDEPGGVPGSPPSGKPRIDLFTFIQKLPHTAPAHRYHMEWDNVAALPVSSYEHWWSRQASPKVRNKVRRAETGGVVVKEVAFDDELVKGITAIYDECPVRQGRSFWHYNKGVDRVREENGTFLDRSVFLGAYFEGRLIGFAKLMIQEDRSQAGLMQILSMIAYRDKAPTNALIAHAVRVCCERNVAYLVYANFSYGNKQRDSLSDFKHYNGFQRIEIPRYYVPLTAVGRLALHAGVHKGFLGRIPEPILARLRSIRARWHAAELLKARHAR